MQGRAAGMDCRIESTAVRFDLFPTILDGEGMPPAPSPSRRHYRAFMSFTPEAGNPLKLRADWVSRYS
jgi:hypothetical protein